MAAPCTAAAHAPRMLLSNGIAAVCFWQLLLIAAKELEATGDPAPLAARKIHRAPLLPAHPRLAG